MNRSFAGRKRHSIASNARRWTRLLWAISSSRNNERRVAPADSMKVLLLNLYYPPDTSATAKMAAAFIEPLAQKHDVTVICGRPSYDPTERRSWKLWQTEQQ